MPLRDHFHQPLSPRRHWEAFHNAWATYLAAEINRQLPEGYFAEPNVHFGIEVDVATWEEAQQGAGMTANREDSSSSLGEVKRSWTPPAPTLTLPFTLITDIVEVVVHGTSGGATLAGAIELVSPANKDRPAHRDAFVAKCKAYLQEGVGLIVVDIVTERHADLHEDLLNAAAPGGILPERRGGSPVLYAGAYRAVEAAQDATLEVWHEALSLSGKLPVLPLWLRGGPCLPVDLEKAYEITCRELRIR